MEEASWPIVTKDMHTVYGEYYRDGVAQCYAKWDIMRYVVWCSIQTFVYLHASAPAAHNEWFN